MVHSGIKNSRNIDDVPEKKEEFKKINLEKIENHILFIFDNGYPTLDDYDTPFKKFEDALSLPVPSLI